MDLLCSLKNLLGYWAVQATSSSGIVDNWIFSLHYKFTSVILIICSICVAINQLFLRPIICTASISSSYDTEAFCWMLKSFSIPLGGIKMDDKTPHPGKPQVFHAYHRWICFVLLFQAVLFYLPGHLWKAMERGRIRKLTLGLNFPVLPEETKKNETRLIVNYLLSSLHQNGRLFFYFLAAEVLNFINVVVQVCLIDSFFDKEFSTYGLKVMNFTESEPKDRDDPMIKIFPRMVRCTLYRIGASGTLQKHDSMCTFLINDVSEKIYNFLWFWLFILTILSGFALIYRIAIILSSKIRFLSTKSRDAICDAVHLKIIVEKSGVGDWFMLNLLAKNVDPQNFKDIAHDLANDLDEKLFYLENCNTKKSF